MRRERYFEGRNSCSKLMSLAKKMNLEEEQIPASCRRCPYYRPDFKYRTCLFADCRYPVDRQTFRSRPLARDMVSVMEVVLMDEE